MNWLFDQPLYIIVIGVLMAAMLAGGFLQTGRNVLFFAALGCLVLTGAMVGVERLVVTDREAVRQTLLDAAQAVENNDLDAVLEIVHPKAENVRALAQSVQRQHHFTSVRITRFERVEILADRNPPVAEIEFVVIVEGNLSNQPMRVPRRVLMTLTKDGDHWRAVEFEHTDVMKRS